MKLEIVLITLLISVSIVAYSQDKLKVGIITTNSSTFHIQSMSKSLMIVSDASNPLKYTRFKVLEESQYQDPNVVFDTFLKAFSKSRLHQLAPERFMTVVFYYDHLGRVSTIQYYLQKNTLITSTELDALNKLLKRDVIFIVPPDVKDDNLAPHTNNIFFNTLIEKSSVK